MPINPTDTPRLPRVATWDDIRPGAVVKTIQGYEYTVTAVGRNTALNEYGGAEYNLHREKVDAGRITLIADAPALPADVASFAALMADSPELLEALRALRNCIRDTRGPDSRKAVEEADRLLERHGGR